MTTKQVLTLIVLGGSIALNVALIYTISQNAWAITHPKQVQEVRANYEGYDRNWTLKGLGQ